MSIDNRTTASRLIWGGWKIGETLSVSKDGRNASFELFPSSEGDIALLRVITFIEENGDRASLTKQEKLEYDNNKILLRQKALNDLTVLMSTFQSNAHIMKIINFTTRDWNDDGKYGCDLFIHTEKYETLRLKLEEGRAFSEYEICRIGKDICSALALAHSKGIIHMNVKPESIFIGNKSFRLGDFGLEQIFENRTTNCMFYAAPESINDGIVNELSDVYSLGLTLYELCGGSIPPFPDSHNAVDMNVKLKWNDLPELKNVSPELSSIISRACAYEPSERFQSVKEFSSALDALNIAKPDNSEDIFINSCANNQVPLPSTKKTPVNIEQSEPVAEASTRSIWSAPTATQPIWNNPTSSSTLAQSTVQMPPSQRAKVPTPRKAVTKVPSKTTPTAPRPQSTAASGRTTAPVTARTAPTATQPIWTTPAAQTAQTAPTQQVQPVSQASTPVQKSQPAPKAVKPASVASSTPQKGTSNVTTASNSTAAPTPSWAKPAKAEPGSIRCANSITLDPDMDPTATSTTNNKKDEKSSYIKLIGIIALLVVLIAAYFIITSSCNNKDDDTSTTKATTTTTVKNVDSSDSSDSSDSTTATEGETETTETEAPEPEFTAKTFVENCYNIALGREPDELSRDEMASELEGKIAYGSQVAYALIASEEYANLDKSDSDYVNDLYLMMFNRTPDESEVSYWTEQIQGGLERYQVFEVCANSNEFYDFCSSYGVESGYFSASYDAITLSNINRFVTKIYLGCLNRLPDQYGQQYWCAALLSNEALGRDLAATLIFSSEFTDLNLSNTDFMSRMYLTFFDREADEDGFVYWVDQLDSGVTREEVFMGFSDAPEFAQLCEKYGVTN